MNLTPATVRTVVPIVYAVLIKIGFAHLGLPNAVTTDVATVAVTGALYVLVRLAERVEPRFGVLLGWVGAPQYADPVNADLTHAKAATKPELQQALDGLRDDLVNAIGSDVEAKVTAALKKPAVAPRKTSAKKAAAKTTAAAKS